MERQARRVHGLGTTVFAEMSALALATGSINLGQGFPDTDGPPEVAAAAIEAIRAGQNQYPPGTGIPVLREAIAAHRERTSGLTYDPDGEVLVTTGATEAIAAALLSLVDPGDEVVVLEPYYDSYVACIGFAGGTRRPVTLRPPTYALDPDELRRAVTTKTRVLLINTPHNPTGAVLSREELASIAEVAIEHDLVVVTDEVYEHMAFDADRPHVAARLAARDARADAVHQLGRQDLRVHRVEDRLGHGAGRPGRGRTPRQAVPDLRLRRAVPAGRGRRARAARQLLHRPAGRARRQARPAVRRARVGGPRRPPTAGHVLRDDRRTAAGLRRRLGVLPRPARAGRRRRHPARTLLGRHRDRCPAGAVGVLQARRGPGRRGRPAARRPSREHRHLAGPDVAR